jgi:hypothetical protein
MHEPISQIIRVAIKTARVLQRTRILGGEDLIDWGGSPLMS